VVEQLIEFTASGMGRSVEWLASTGILFAVFAVVWVAFGAAVLRSQGTVDQAWRRIRALSIALQLVIWVLLLPVMIGLWIWETTWPVLVRATLVLGVAGWNLFMFLPSAAR
jgi:hypothetical protein